MPKVRMKAVKTVKEKKMVDKKNGQIFWCKPQHSVKVGQKDFWKQAVG